MQALWAILIMLAAFFTMEGVAWLTHKYVMHGVLWELHKDHHHKESDTFFEKNDYFFLIFAIPGIALLAAGSFLPGMSWMLFTGTGITLYGITYFLMHDIFIHQRFRVFRQSNNAYLRALRRAHKVHHKHLDKSDGECFGMLLFPFKYLKYEWKHRK